MLAPLGAVPAVRKQFSIIALCTTRFEKWRTVRRRFMSAQNEVERCFISLTGYSLYSSSKENLCSSASIPDPFCLSPFFVIPAKAGIQFFQLVTEFLDSGFHRSDDFLRNHQTLVHFPAASGTNRHFPGLSGLGCALLVVLSKPPGIRA